MVKVLLFGPVRGQFELLVSKVQAVNRSKAGPFDIVLCVGEFSGGEGEEDEALLGRYLSGEEALPLPTYFHEPGGSPSLNAILTEHALATQEVTPTLHYLGRGGVKTVGKLTIAFLARNHTAEELEDAARLGTMGGYGGSDFLLTTEWPRGFDADLPSSTVSSLVERGMLLAAVGDPDVAAMALSCRPRYHMAAAEGLYYQRPPYKNAGAGKGREHVTRFIGLGNVPDSPEAVAAAAGDKALKWFHALSVEPISFMPKEQLAEQPEGTTNCPYILQTATSSVGTKRQRVEGPLGMGDGADLKRAMATPVWAKRAGVEEEKRTDAGVFRWGESGGRGGRGRGRGRESDRGGRGGGVQNNSTTTLFVGNLKPGDVTSNDLKQTFGVAGPIKYARVNPGASFGFVDFEKPEDAAHTLASMDGVEIKGYNVRLHWAQERGDQRENGAGSARKEEREERRPPPVPADPDNCTVFVGNLPKPGGFSDERLHEVLVTLGVKAEEIKQCRSVQDKGFGFVEFISHEAAAAVIAEFDGKEAAGIRLRMSWGKGPVLPRGAARGYPGSENEMAPGVPASFSEDPRQDCWFCLASPLLEDHLVISIGEEVYCALPKGALKQGHVLLVPVAHIQRYSELTAPAAAEMERYKAALRSTYAKSKCELYCFERCLATKKGTHHMHLQVVPVPSGEEARGARMLLKSEGRRFNMTFEELPATADLSEALAEGSYFFAEVPGDEVGSIVRLICRVDEEEVKKQNLLLPPGRAPRTGVPLEFGRDVASRLLLAPEKAHWKTCSVSKKEEEAQAEKFKAVFKPFDFTVSADDDMVV